MADVQLVAEPGRTEGSRSSRRLRREGRIPAIVYGHGIEPIAVSIDARELRVALNGEAGSRALLDLRVGGERHLAVARQLQRHPVRHTVTHVDFQVVSRDEIISADIPINLVGDAVAVHRGDGTVAQDLTALTVKARPADLPPHIEVDVSELEIGGSIRVSDITLPDGVETDADPEQVVVVGQPPRVALPEEQALEEGEAAEGAGAEGGAASTESGDSASSGGEGAGES
jgi:large subunit ribosomal protein L25